MIRNIVVMSFFGVALGSECLMLFNKVERCCTDDTCAFETCNSTDAALACVVNGAECDNVCTDNSKRNARNDSGVVVPLLLFTAGVCICNFLLGIRTALIISTRHASKHTEVNTPKPEIQVHSMMEILHV